MKNIFNHLTIFALALLLAQCSVPIEKIQFTTDTENCDQCPPLSCLTYSSLGEDDINLDDFFKTINEVIDENERFVTCMKYHYNLNENRLLNNTSLKIKMCAMVKFFTDVNNANSKLNGVKIHFGLDGAAIKFIFQPVYMNNPDWDSPFGKYKYTITQEGGYYVYNETDNKFETKNASDINPLINAYLEKIRIIHKGTTDPPETMNMDTDSWERDTWSVIYSFREIFELYESNFNCSVADESRYCEDLYFYNGVSEDSHLIFQKRNKHTIFITVQSLEQLKKYSDDKKNVRTFLVGGSAANMAHLCPPSCDPVYKVRSFGVRPGVKSTR